MLSDKDKREMLEDGLSVKRRENFKAAARVGKKEPFSLLNYLNFLADLQKVCGEFPVSQRKINTAENKL